MRFVLGVMFLSFLVFLPTALAQENGKIYYLSYSPAEPFVLEDTIISIGVENTGEKTQSYSLQLQIVDEGKVVHEEEFTFSLEKSKGISLTPHYTPQDIGQHEVIFKLYDKFKVDLFDTKIIDFNAVSNLGPFDIIIDPLATRVRPGFALPVNVLLENMGKKSVDAEVKMSIVCPNTVLTQTFTVFVPSNNQSRNLVSMQTCEQEGMYDVVGSIMLFNKTWVSASSQFFVNSSYIVLQFDVPEKITIKAGESYTFPVEVTNLGNQKISNLQFIIQRIPLTWQKISPSAIIEVEPNEKVLFVINITIPQDAEPKSYEARMTATAEEVLERKISTLEITPLAVLPVASTVKTPTYVYILISISSASGLTIVGFLLRNYLKGKTRTIPMQNERLKILQKIKERIKSK